MTFDRVHHVAYTVENLDEYVDMFEKLLGKEPSNVLTLEDADYKVAVFDLEGILIEVQTPLENPDPSSPGEEMKNFLDSWGDGLNHVAYEVQDIEKAKEEFEEMGFEMDEKGPEIAPSFPEFRIIDLKEESTKGIYFQLVDSKGKE